MKSFLNKFKNAITRSNKSEYRTISYAIVNVIDFVTLAEQLTPEDLYNLLVNYTRCVESIASKHHGHIEKILGDHISVYWIHSDATNLKTNGVVQAAYEITKKKSELHPQLDLSIGVATGKALAVEGVYVGATCNIASHLLEMSKYSKNRIVVCEVTNRQQGIFNTQKIVSKSPDDNQRLRASAYELML